MKDGRMKAEFLQRILERLPKKITFSMMYNVTNEVTGAVYVKEYNSLIFTDDVQYVVDNVMYDLEENEAVTFAVFRATEDEEEE
jgi:hypothetical protein